MARKKQVIRDFYRPREVAARMGLAPNTVYRLIAANKIPALTFPGHPMLLVPASFVDGITAQLFADWEASNAGERAGDPAGADAPLGADNPEGRAVDEAADSQLAEGNDGHQPE